MGIRRLARALTLSLVSLVAVSCGGQQSPRSVANRGDDSHSLADSTVEGHTLDSSEGGFSVTLPPGFSEPKQNGKKYQAFNEQNHSMVLAQYLDLPEYTASDADKDVFNLALGVALQRERATIEKEEKLTVQGHPAYSVRASGLVPNGSATLYYRHQYVRDGTRLYELLLASPKRAELDSDESEAFFQSFRLNGEDRQSNSSRPTNSTTPLIVSDAPPPPPPRPVQAPSTPRAPVSAGALDSSAMSNPLPVYPTIARTVHASGKVVVQVTVDEKGRVIEARAISGHVLLQAAAVQAARQAQFNPGPPMTGTLTYTFKAQ